jgi:hypothetical protein
LSLPLIAIEVIPHASQRYDTVGDWDVGGHITVSDMGNEDYEFLVGLHELVEWYLCRKRGISDEAVTAFDKSYDGPGEPGDALWAPYRAEHKFATFLERQVAMELGVDWNEYDKAVEGL